MRLALIFAATEGPYWLSHVYRTTLSAAEEKGRALLLAATAQSDAHHVFVDSDGKITTVHPLATQESDFDLWNDADFVKLLEKVPLRSSRNEHANLHHIPKDIATRLCQQFDV